MIPEENLNSEFNSKDCSPDPIFENAQQQQQGHGDEADGIRRDINDATVQNWLAENAPPNSEDQSNKGKSKKGKSQKG